MKKNAHAVAVAAALIIVMVLFSSMVFLAVESSHHCAEGECRICCQMAQVEGVLKNAAALGAGCALAVTAMEASPSPAVCTGWVCLGETLVSHKVKLSR